MKRIRLFVILWLCTSCSGVETQKYEDDYCEYIISDATKHFSDTLSCNVDNDFITSVEVQITGYVKGNAIIEFENGAGRLEKILLNDTTKYLYKTEWYENRLIFVYTPIDEVTNGNIILRYKFYSI